jgi:hypothetical protein
MTTWAILSTLGLIVIGLLVFYIKRSASKAIQLDLREDEIDAAKKASDRRKRVHGLSDDELDKLLE